MVELYSISYYILIAAVLIIGNVLVSLMRKTDLLVGKLV